MRIKRGFFEWGLFLLLLLLTVAFSNAFQQTLVQRGKGIGDDVHYLSIAAQYLNGEPFSGVSPFVYRQFTPWLASLIAGSEEQLYDAFHTVSLLSGILAACLTLLLLRAFIRDWRLRLALASLFPLAWFLPVRMSFWTPVNTDPTGILMILIMLLLCQHFRKAAASPDTRARSRAVLVGWMTLAVFISVFTRSSLILFALMLPLCTAFSPQAATMKDKLVEKTKQLHPLLLLPLMAGIVTFVAIRLNTEASWVFAENTLGKSIYGPLLIYFNHVYSVSLAQQLHELYTYWGPLLVLLLWRLRTVARFLGDHWHILLCLAINAAYATFADGRFFAYAYPVFLLLLGIVIQDNTARLHRRKGILAVLILAQLITLRVFWTMPADYPINAFLDEGPMDALVLFTPFTSDFNYWDIHPFINRHFYGQIVATQHLILSLLALFFLADFRQRDENRSDG